MKAPALMLSKGSLRSLHCRLVLKIRFPETSD